MSKTKTKQRHRELKRDSARKLAAAQKKAAKQNTPAQPPAKKQKPNPKKDAPTTTTTPIASNTPAKPPPKSSTKPQQASQKHEIPFGVYDNILLVGEGDFSFTRSLAIEHGCANVVGTSFDSETEVREKYPTFEEIEKELKDLTPPVPIYHGVDATKLSGYKFLRAGSEKGTGGGPEEDDTKGWDIIAFLFPHTGGLSTDLNRQARSNQALLVKFFESCIYSPPPRPPRMTSPSPFLKPGGKVIVTLFEGAAYELWCIKNLARHAGLKVVESYKFDWAQYPGYHHVRTLGAIEGGGGWKGEDRDARVYVFEKEAEGPKEKGGKDGKKDGGKGSKEKAKGKRGRDDSDSDSDSEG